MKTQTKGQILKIIKETGPIRPNELVQKLKISPQALHRHLKSLVQSGLLEQKGSAPHTRYAQAGMPDFSQALEWLKTRKLTQNPSAVCETRDVLSARLSHFSSFLKQGLSADDLPLIISIVGEIGNNSFDHNLGQWIDVPGCWLESVLSGSKLWICIADRGQGVFQSLSRVDSSLKTDQAAIETAFEKRISGRAPEQRGNGLKFVKNIITQNENRGISCRSGHGQVDYGTLGKDCRKTFEKVTTKINGTITLIAWSLK